VHFTTQVKAGNAVLKPGMYQVQHVVEGSDHVIIFKEMELPAGYKMGNTPVGKEVSRITCKVEPVSKAVNNTKITLRTKHRWRERDRRGAGRGRGIQTPAVSQVIL
jgi:hypothetical protein